MTPGSRLDPDRLLALSYVSLAKRPALAALWELDALLADVALGGREPMIARIKLAWWRDALETLDAKPPPGEPVLQALAEHTLPAKVTGAQLARLAESWETLEDLEACAEERGSLLFRLSARLLCGAYFSRLELAGQIWALVDLARRQGRSSTAHEGRLGKEPWPSALRPLGMLVALAERDAGRSETERQGSPARMLRMLRHRLTGH